MSPKTLTFHELCDIITSSSDWSERDLALKTIAKSKINDVEQEQLLFDVSINLLRSTNITCHRTAAQVLSALPHTLSEWLLIVEVALITACTINNTQKDTSRAKSVKHLINMAIQAHPEPTSTIICYTLIIQ